MSVETNIPSPTPAEGTTPTETTPASEAQIRLEALEKEVEAQKTINKILQDKLDRAEIEKGNITQKATAQAEAGTDAKAEKLTEIKGTLEFLGLENSAPKNASYTEKVRIACQSIANEFNPDYKISTDLEGQLRDLDNLTTIAKTEQMRRNEINPLASAGNDGVEYQCENNIEYIFMQSKTGA